MVEMNISEKGLFGQQKKASYPLQWKVTVLEQSGHR